MSPVRRARAAFWVATVGFLLFASLSSVEARRKRKTKAPRPPLEQDERRQIRLVFAVQEETGEPLRTFHYRLRLPSGPELEGACPRDTSSPSTHRCTDTGFSVTLPPSVPPTTLDIGMDAPGRRPLLLSISPTYRTTSVGLEADLLLRVLLDQPLPPAR